MHEDELDVERWAKPFYLKFLHGNFVSPGMHYDEKQEQWNDRVRVALREITPEIVGDLLSDENWRAKLPGAWFCGLKKWDNYTLDIGRLLIRRKDMISTQGYSFALARFASHASANYLTGQMDHVLKNGLDYDNETNWLIGAMLWIDFRLDTSHAVDYIGLWHQMVRERVEQDERYGPGYAEVVNADVAKNRFWRIMEYVEDHFDSA